MTKSPREILEKLVLEVGSQVTRDYDWKHGIWEGMSVSNKVSLDNALTDIKEAVLASLPSKKGFPPTDSFEVSESRMQMDCPSCGNYYHTDDDISECTCYLHNEVVDQCTKAILTMFEGE